MAGVTAAELAEWFDRHAAALVLYARQWVGAAVAEDIVQDVFVRLAGKGAGRPGPEKIRAYLFAAVRHGAMDAARGRRRREARDRRTGELPLLAVREEKAEEVDAGEIERALAGIGAQEREIVTLRIWAGATFQEIGEVTGLPVSTVHVRYQQAIEALRQFWEVPCRNH
jgi:RNA polymerase sigma factor (sigma-70 family)